MPLTSGSRDYDALLEQVADAQVVLLSDSSHGTAEFYRDAVKGTMPAWSPSLSLG